MVTADLLSRARAGDGEAFRELTGPRRRPARERDVSQYEPAFGAAAYEACSRRRAREARRLMRLPQTEVLHQTRAWFFELS